MKEVETSAKTVALAIELALEKLGVSSEEAEVDVLSEGKTGMMGLGAEEARVRVRLISPEPIEPGQESEAVAVARAVLETLLSKLGIEGAYIETQAGISVMPGEDAGDTVVLAIRGDDLGILIGRRGQTLACIQYILRLMVANRLKTFAPVVVDVNDYRQRRLKALQAMAMLTAEQVKEKEMPCALEPMSAFERRIIHMTLTDHPDVTTQSVGLGDARKVVVVLRED